MKKHLTYYDLKHKIALIENKVDSALEAPNWQTSMELHSHVSIYAPNAFAHIEGMNFGHVMTEEYMIFTVRFNKNIHKKMRISFWKDLFEIKRIINENMSNKWLKIIALKI